MSTGPISTGPVSTGPVNTGSPYRHLFTPLRVGPLTVANRVVFAAHLTNYARDGLRVRRDDPLGLLDGRLVHAECAIVHWLVGPGPKSGRSASGAPHPGVSQSTGVCRPCHRPRRSSATDRLIVTGIRSGARPSRLEPQPSNPRMEVSTERELTWRTKQMQTRPRISLARTRDGWRGAIRLSFNRGASPVASARTVRRPVASVARACGARRTLACRLLRYRTEGRDRRRRDRAAGV